MARCSGDIRPVSYGTAGIGTTPHLSAERIFKLGAGLAVNHVPHRGAGPALNDVAGGHLDLASVALPAATELVKSGKVTGLAVTSSKRAPSLPNVPTVAEAGFAAGDDATWVALFLPVAASPALIAKIDADVNAAIEAPDVKESLEKIGFSPVGRAGGNAKDFVRTEVVKWGEVVKKLGLRVDN